MPGWRKSVSGIAFAALMLTVVVTVAVTLSGALALELITYVFRGSVVEIAQFAFGAFVLQEK